MKKILKKEVIIAFIVGALIASSIAVYAYSYAAKDIGYTKPGTETEISVETALNDLYKKLFNGINIGNLKLGGGPSENKTYYFDKNYSNNVIMICSIDNYSTETSLAPGENMTYCNIINATGLTYSLLRHETNVSGLSREVLDVYLLSNVTQGSSITCNARYNAIISFWC